MNGRRSRPFQQAFYTKKTAKVKNFKSNLKNISHRQPPLFSISFKRPWKILSKGVSHLILLQIIKKLQLELLFKKTPILLTFLLYKRKVSCWFFPTLRSHQWTSALRIRRGHKRCTFSPHFLQQQQWRWWCSSLFHRVMSIFIIFLIFSKVAPALTFLLFGAQSSAIHRWNGFFAVVWKKYWKVGVVYWKFWVNNFWKEQAASRPALDYLPIFLPNSGLRLPQPVLPSREGGVTRSNPLRGRDRSLQFVSVNQESQ